MQLWEPGFYGHALRKFDILPINRHITQTYYQCIRILTDLLPMYKNSFPSREVEMFPVLALAKKILRSFESKLPALPEIQ